MMLPTNAVVLGLGGTFDVPPGGFEGWMRMDDNPWQADHCSGKTACIEYAAPYGSDVWKLNTPDLFVATTADHGGVIPLSDLPPACNAWKSNDPLREWVDKAGWREPMPVNPADPYGIPQNAPGAKNDNGKLMASLILEFSRALWAVGEAATHGAVKYTRDGWQHVPDGERRYKDAAMRHLLQAQQEELDQESGMPHMWHYAWNVLASLELNLRNK